jgi:glycine/D-amino acid oxidase-like deaminating enzyme
MKITSTYALATQPLDQDQLWMDQVLIWETARPYLYLRTTAEGRMLAGGADEPFKDERKRDALLERKERLLLSQCAAVFPHLKGVTADFSWCGSFAETDDGLPYIGEYPGIKGISFALGYGGNGTTFAMIAAEMIRNKLQGQKDAREKLFGFRR